MKRHLYSGLLLATIGGCAEQEPEHVEVVSQFVRVKDGEGQDKVVPAGELYNTNSGQPQYERVWVVDRQGDRCRFVPLEQLESESPADARYVLATVGSARE